MRRVPPSFPGNGNDGGTRRQRVKLAAATLRRAAAVVGARGNVLDGPHLEAGGLQRADGGFAAGTRTLHEHVDLLHAVFLRPRGGRLGSHLGSVRGRLARALEPDLAGRGPRDDGTGRVRDGHDGVVEGALDVRLTQRDVLLVLATRLADRSTSLWGHC